MGSAGAASAVSSAAAGAGGGTTGSSSTSSKRDMISCVRVRANSSTQGLNRNHQRRNQTGSRGYASHPAVGMGQSIITPTKRFLLLELSSTIITLVEAAPAVLLGCTALHCTACK